MADFFPMGMFGGPMGGMKKSSDSEGNDLKRGVKIGLKQNMEKLPEGASKKHIRHHHREN